MLEWHDAVNAQDVERLVALSAENVEVGGPRGAGRGSALLREWFARAGVRLEPGRVFARENRVVVEQDATWPGQPPQIVASAFEVHDGRVSRVIRYAALTEALEAAALDERAAVLG
ncbi:MAG TPA: nuclear transport factor 2 family protein [Chloroflexota bacterium]|nr:nuclear transport factor 2 family protein [Chloroflexota bacterium]